MDYRLLLLLGLTTDLSGAPAWAQQEATEQAQAEREFAERVSQIDGIFAAEAAKGGSFIVRYDRRKHSFAKSYGHLDCARTTPMRNDAMVDAGSITKAFTYAAIYKLVSGSNGLAFATYYHLPLLDEVLSSPAPAASISRPRMLDVLCRAAATQR